MAASVRLPGGMPLLPGGPFAAGFPQVPTDPVLKFTFLSEVLVKTGDDGQTIVTKISNLTTRADHFYVSYGAVVHNYKILFGAGRYYQEGSVLTEKHVFPKTVSCLHCSKLQPLLVVVGTETGGVYMWDLRRGPHGIPPTQVCAFEVSLVPMLVLGCHDTCT